MIISSRENITSKDESNKRKQEKNRNKITNMDDVAGRNGRSWNTGRTNLNNEDNAQSGSNMTYRANA